MFRTAASDGVLLCEPVERSNVSHTQAERLEELEKKGDAPNLHAVMHADMIGKAVHARQQNKQIGAGVGELAMIISGESAVPRYPSSACGRTLRTSTRSSGGGSERFSSGLWAANFGRRSQTDCCARTNNAFLHPYYATHDSPLWIFDQQR